jgi:hypothetical protein
MLNTYAHLMLSTQAHLMLNTHAHLMLGHKTCCHSIIPRQGGMALLLIKEEARGEAVG